MKIEILIVLVYLMLSLTGCEKNANETDPVKAILGKWEITELGNWPNMEPITEPTGYEEFLADSVLREYDYETQSFKFYKKYWIDSLLHIYITRDDGYKIFFEYKYLFFDNKVQLDLLNWRMTYNTSVYKRLNNLK